MKLNIVTLLLNLKVFDYSLFQKLWIFDVKLGKLKLQYDTNQKLLEQAEDDLAVHFNLIMIIHFCCEILFVLIMII
jgi:hypothetical protein